LLTNDCTPAQSNWQDWSCRQLALPWHLPFECIAPGTRATAVLLVAAVRAEPPMHDCVQRLTPRDSPVRSLDLWKT
jgi:hypothetical protein